MKIIRLLFCFTVLGLFSAVIEAQTLDNVAKGQAIDMLNNVQSAIKKEYYDDKFGGVDLDVRFKAAKEKLKSAVTLGQAFSIIAQAVIELNDSHTRFFPPATNHIVEYGLRMKLFGNKAFIIAILPGSDAEKQGLHVGDEILKLNGFFPTRSELWKMIYYYYTLNPQTKLALEVKNPTGQIRQIEVTAKITELKRVVSLYNSIDFAEAVREGDKLSNSQVHYFKEIGNALIWKMPSFVFDPVEVATQIARARDKQFLILDLRGNGGGYVVTLEKLAGFFFEKDTKIADLKGRKKMDPQMAKTEGKNVYKGNVIVLIDSASGSAAEIFARLMQIEQRGIVLGDRSAGAVMQSKGIRFDAGVNTMIDYSMNLTMADVIMTDGRSLERVGVEPNVTILPSGNDLATQRDPVLAAALQLTGNKIDPSEAGKLFPPEKVVERGSHFAIRLFF
jgi:C-terminal processing protease CtpA/Prc